MPYAHSLKVILYDTFSETVFGLLTIHHMRSGVEFSSCGIGIISAQFGDIGCWESWDPLTYSRGRFLLS